MLGLRAGFLETLECGHHFCFDRPIGSQLMAAAEASDDVGIDRLRTLELHSGVSALGAGYFNLHVAAFNSTRPEISLGRMTLSGKSFGENLEKCTG
jgi:hypothetical protein